MWADDIGGFVTWAGFYRMEDFLQNKSLQVLWPPILNLSNDKETMFQTELNTPTGTTNKFSYRFSPPTSRRTPSEGEGPTHKGYSMIQ